MGTTDTKALRDTIVIYFSHEDNCWVGHSLKTDQIGTGESVLTALTDAIRAVDTVHQIAHDDPSVAFLRDAPTEIQEMAKTAPLLPKELYEIAHRRVRGTWPDELLLIDVKPGNDKRWVSRIPEEVPC
jgi:hypothetical protein